MRSSPPRSYRTAPPLGRCPIPSLFSPAREGLEAIPEDAMVHEQQVCARGRRFLDDSLRGVHSRNDSSDLVPPGHLKAVQSRPVIRMVGDAQILVHVLEQRF